MNYKMSWHRMHDDLGNDPENVYISIDFTDNANILYCANISFADAKFILNNIDLVYNNGKDNRKMDLI